MEILANQKSLVVKKRGEINLINFEDISFIEKFRNKCIIATCSGKENEIRIGLKYLEKKLPTYFIRSHRSFLINTKKVSLVKYDQTLSSYVVYFLDDKSDYAILNGKKINQFIDKLVRCE